MTATEWLFKELWECDKDKLTWHSILEKAKEMEKQQIIDAYNKSFELRDKPYSTAESYYNETYGSKGSDELGNSLEWNGEATEGHNIHTSSQTEISDKEIYKQADKEFRHFEDEDKDIWITACQWYREQLKKKQ